MESVLPIYKELESCLWRGVLDTALSDEVCQWLSGGRWSSPSTPVSSTNKTDRHDIPDILMKVALNSITITVTQFIKVLYIMQYITMNKMHIYENKRIFLVNTVKGCFHTGELLCVCSWWTIRIL